MVSIKTNTLVTIYIKICLKIYKTKIANKKKEMTIKSVLSKHLQPLNNNTLKKNTIYATH